MFKKSLKRFVNFEQLPDKMKNFEATTDQKINIKDIFAIRLDGNNFHQYTKPFNKPFDQISIIILLNIVHKNLVEATKVIFKQYSPITAYICSDEISILFHSNFQTNLFSGRIQKISSVFASKVTLEFYIKMIQSLPQYEQNKNYNLIKNNIEKGVTFDARVFNLPNEQEALEYILWRSAFDCVRNSKNLLATCYYTQDEVNGIKTLDITDKLLKEKGVDWNKYPDIFKYGTFIKKVKYFKKGLNPKTNETVNVERTKLEEISKLLSDKTEDKEFLFSQFCDDRGLGII